MQSTEDIKKLLIITGPQGSGNHLWSKIFAMHPIVVGWPMLRKEWQGHHEEPFNKYWQQPETLQELDTDKKHHFVTSISCPYYKDKEPHVPKYAEFISEAKKKFDSVVVCIIGRDRDILNIQQTRVRKGHTTPIALEQFDKLADVKFISTELLFLYGEQYLKALQKDLDFPVAWNHATLIKDYLKENTNKKYLIEPDTGAFDEQVYKAVSES